EDLDHRSGVGAVARMANGVELTVSVQPQDPRRGSLLDDGVPPAWRLRAADRLHRLLRPAMGAHLGRGLSRRLADAVSAGSPRVWLLLSGRRSARRIAVPGRI